MAKVKRKHVVGGQMPVTATAPSERREYLESLLRLRKLDHTLNAGHQAPGIAGETLRWLVPTGIAELDQRLDGGLPRGHLSEVIGPRSSGRLTVLVSALAAATERGEAVALIDPLDMFDPVSAAATPRHRQGVRLDFSRMLWVRGEATASARTSLSCEYGTLQKSIDRAVKALNLVLQAGGFGLVVLDLGEVASQAIKRLPYTTWLRLHRVIECSDTACVLIGTEPIARSAGGVSVLLSAPKAHASTPDVSRSVRVIRSRAMEVDRDVCLSLSAPAC
jgi:recombination protein RecA